MVKLLVTVMSIFGSLLLSECGFIASFGFMLSARSKTLLHAFQFCERCLLSVWKFVPLWGATWHSCDLTFIEPSVVKVDYGKMSASDLSSLEIALWYLELQEMI